jgi:hypothetical protein
MQLIQPFGLGTELGAALLGQESDFVIGVVHSRPRFLPSPDSKGKQRDQPRHQGHPRFRNGAAQGQP